MSALEPGTKIGEYVVEGPLTKGGMSMLYAATHPVIGKRAVLKVPLDEHALAATAERFEREARAVNLIRHPNVVDIFGCGQLEDGRHYLLMERLEGETLQARLHRFRLSHSEAHEILIQLSDVLDAAHAQGVLHLDLKPANIFLSPVRGARTLVKVLDFGLAAQLEEVRLPHVPGQFRGTPDYASPEQAQSVAAIGPASDVYSMGVIAFEMFVGKRPFIGETVVSTLLKQIGETPVRPSELVDTISSEEDKLILDMLQKQPELRPSPADVREQLLVLRTTNLRAATQLMHSVVPRR